MKDRYCRALRMGSKVGIAALLLLAITGACTGPTAVPEETSVPTESAVTAAPTATEAAPPTEEPTTVPTPVPATPTEPPAPSARYQLAFQATWSGETHPLGFPANPHFSGLIGATHSPAVRVWVEGEVATPGIQNMAETGEKSPLDSEIELLIAEGGACELISGGGVATSPGSVTVEFIVTQECRLVSVVTMIAPSPDWFVGVAGLDLLGGGGWAEEVVVELFPYDAGTDSGLLYTSPDEPTDPPDVIRGLEEEPFLIDGGVPTLGIFTFTRLDE